MSTQDPKKPVSADDKEKIIDLVNSFLFGNGSLDSLEPPIEFLETKKGELPEKPSESNCIRQTFFLAVCMLFGGRCYTKEQNGKSAKTACVDLLSFPGAKERLDQLRARDEENNEIFLCNFPSCKIKNKATVFKFNDAETQKRATDSSKLMFYVATKPKDRKNFFRHMGMHFVGINLGENTPKHDYWAEFELFKVFFPTYCLSTYDNCGSTSEKQSNDTENIIFPRPFPDSKAIMDKDLDPETFVIKDDFIHLRNVHFDAEREISRMSNRARDYSKDEGIEIDVEEEEEEDEEEIQICGMGIDPSAQFSGENGNTFSHINDQNDVELPLMSHFDMNGSNNENGMGSSNSQIGMNSSDSQYDISSPYEQIGTIDPSNSRYNY